MIIENKKPGKFQYFIQRHIKKSIPENFPERGSWITLELRDTDSDAKILIPALLAKVNKREMQVKTRLPFPKKCSKDGILYCSFENANSEKGVFQANRTLRYFTGFEIVNMVSGKTSDIRLVDAIFKRANQREFERLPYKHQYNITLQPVVIPEKDEKIIAYNRLVKQFVENLKIRDIAPGGIGASCSKKFSKMIKANHRIKINVCFGQRMEYRFYKRLITSKTVKRVIKTDMTVVKKMDTGNGEYLFGFKFKDVEKHRYYILDESNRIRQSEAAFIASGA